MRNPNSLATLLATIFNSNQFHEPAPYREFDIPRRNLDGWHIKSSGGLDLAQEDNHIIAALLRNRGDWSPYRSRPRGHVHVLRVLHCRVWWRGKWGWLIISRSVDDPLPPVADW